MAIAVAPRPTALSDPWSMTGPSISKADEIRAYTLEHHMPSWRRSDEKRLAIRAGDVIRGMGLRNARPNVCSALASWRFLHETAIVLVRREGPPQSTTTTFHYASGPATPSRPPHRQENSTPRSSYQQPRHGHLSPHRDGEWRTADLCLVSCVSVKRPVPSRARDLYASPWFRKARACVEAMRCPWYILSAKYGPSRSEFDNRSLQPDTEDHAGEPPTRVGERRDRAPRSAPGRCQLRDVPGRKGIPRIP